MAHKKGMGSTRNGRESHSKRLGVKIFGGQIAAPGNIIIRQRGTQHHPGDGVGMGVDHTIFAKQEGIVHFKKGRKDRSYVSVVSPELYKQLTGLIVKEEVAPKPPAEKKAKPSPPTPKAESAVTPAKEEAAADPRAQLLAIVGEGDASSADDLKKLTGLGPATEKKLNDIGIYTYAQISKLTEAAKSLAEQLTGFKAEKMGSWVDEAKNL